MSGAGAALQAAAMEALAGVAGLGVYAGEPIQAAFPHALVEAELETDWGHKSGGGREVRLAVTLRDSGERPDRLQGLQAAAEEAVAGIGAVAGWQLVTLRLARSRRVRLAKGYWAAVIEFRARMLALG